MSLDSPQPGADGDEDGALVQRVGAHDPAYERVEWRPTVGAAVRELPEREREILRLRFVDDLTQTEIAKRVGVSQMHVSRLLRRSLEKLAAATSG